MAVKTIIKKNTYFDSVSMMVLSGKANEIDGVKQAVIGMGSERNKDVLKNVGLYSEEAEASTQGDLLIVIEAESEDKLEGILEAVDKLMQHKAAGNLSHEVKYASTAQAKKALDKANLAIISVPGIYACREAEKALEQNMNVMIFSDNVTLEEELRLKQYAHSKGLLVMGPDCGTAIIGGKALCFANAVRRGNIGIVAASGTGSQEISVRIHDFGGGISHLIGTGGRDLNEHIGAITMLDGFKALQEDPDTDIIILFSKPPAKSVALKVYEAVKECKKLVVICFLGGDEKEITSSGAVYAKTTKEAALKAVILSGIKEETINTHPLNLPLIADVREKIKPEQKYIRGLFCGGTICSEVLELVSEKFHNVYSNVAKNPDNKLANIHLSKEHTLIDMGDDDFTYGRPHPMIDPSLRIERFIQESKDASVGVIILDFILGYGAHMNPVEIMLPHIMQAKKDAFNEGRHLEILAFVLGTEKDPQGFDKQVQMLEDAGVTIASSIVNTALLSMGFVDKEA